MNCLSFYSFGNSTSTSLLIYLSPSILHKCWEVSCGIIKKESKQNKYAKTKNLDAKKEIKTLAMGKNARSLVAMMQVFFFCFAIKFFSSMGTAYFYLSHLYIFNPLMHFVPDSKML